MYIMESSNPVVVWERVRPGKNQEQSGKSGEIYYEPPVQSETNRSNRRDQANINMGNALVRNYTILTRTMPVNLIITVHYLRR